LAARGGVRVDDIDTILAADAWARDSARIALKGHKQVKAQSAHDEGST
jgi:hypothetical protein